METPFRAQAFTKHQPVTKDDMEVTQANLQWLEDNTPRGRFFRENGAPTDVRSIVISGRVGFGKSRKDNIVRKKVRFGKAFHPDCHPNVTRGVVSDGTQSVFCVFNGPGGRLLPDSTGFEVVIMVPEDNIKDKWKIKKPFHITWHAYGYRRETVNAF